MNNRFFTRLVVLVGLLLGLWMCSKEPCVLPQTPQEPLYSVAKARAFYDRAGSTTRAIAESGPLTPGDYTLDWEQAEVSLDSLLSSVDVPIDMQYRYYRYLQPEADSIELVPIYSKLVVVKEHPTLLEGCYIRYLMPARSMIRAYPDYDYDALLNSRPKTDFSGISLYTDLNGWPMCVAYYYEGEWLCDAFIFDKAHTLEENIERLYDLLGDITVAKCSNTQTRAQQEGPTVDGGEIEDVIILPDWELHLRELLSEINFTHPDMETEPKPTTDGGGGSPTSSSSSGKGEDNSSKHNEDIKYEDEETKEIIEPLLDSISQDCMGKTLLDALDGVTIKTGTGRNGYDSETNTIELSHHNKYGYRDYVLLEELTHCYQRNRYGDMYVSKRLNAEIEAKVGWFLYRQRNPNALLDSTQSEWQQDAFYTPNGVKAMHQLAQHHLLETSIENSDYQNCYRNLAAALSVHRIDKNGVEHNAYATYSFSWDLQDWVFTCLQTLMENC